MIPERVPSCDAEHPSIYSDGNGGFMCRCIVCARCKQHTGNATQGHFWAWCKKTKQKEEFHFCCPGLPCEYKASNSTGVMTVSEASTGETK